MSAFTFDVAIIGYGPCGAVAAALLGQSGLRVLVVDKSHTLYDLPRAVALDHEVMRIFQGLGIAESVQAHTEPFTQSEHFGAAGQLIRRVGMLQPPYPLGWTPSMVFRQPVVEQILRDHVASLLSVEVRLGVELMELLQDAEGAQLRLRSDSGGTHVERVRYVIGCDGASSTVRRLLGIAVEDLGFNEPWLVVDLLANERGLAKLPQVSTHFCDPSRPSMFVVGTGNHRRWEFMLLPGETPEQMDSEAWVWRTLSRWITPGDAVLWRRASYRFRALNAKQWRRARVFLAGDAAHQQPPFLGQGMCQGIRDASNLGWKLKQVLAGDAGEALLDSYEEERSGHVSALIGIILGIGQYICELDPNAAHARDARLLAEADGAIKTLVRQDLMPGLQRGFLSASTHPALGTLFPQPSVLQSGRPVLLDDVAGGGWRVVLGDDALTWQPHADAPMNVFRVSTTEQSGAWHEMEGVLGAWLARYACMAAIVRPDHYVYAVADSAAALDAELRALSSSIV